jgi:hypothetical protein
MVKFATIETFALSGKKAKMRTINCSNGNLLNCYFGIVNKNNNTAIISKRDIILQAIKKLQDIEKLIEIEIETQTAASEFGFIDAELGYNLKKIRALSVVLTNKTIDTYDLSSDFLEEISNGMPIIVSVLKVLSQMTKGSYGERIATALKEATNSSNVTSILPPSFEPDNPY